MATGSGRLIETRAAVAQLVERVLGKDEVMGPNPISSSDCRPSGAKDSITQNTFIP